MAGEPGEALRPSVTHGAQARERVSRAFARLEGRVAMTILLAMAVIYVIELLIFYRSGSDVFDSIFVLERAHMLDRPWTLITSIFAHDPQNPYHIFLNGLALFFFGPALESLIGSRRFFGLFMGSGILAGIGQLVLSAALYPNDPTLGVLGASGAIMGVLGALTVIAPNLSVLVFFVIPAPLWIVTAAYALLDFAATFTPGNVANLAHLTGLAVGLLYGQRLRERGVRARVRPSPPHLRW
ncbi:MAG: rhomboid family intramembrane serine protease [Thermoplasmatota archaeon]